MPLTDAKVRAAEPRAKQYVLGDALGLELLVTPSGGKTWRFRWRQEGRMKRITIGPYPEVGLSAARVKVATLRASVWGGQSPLRRPEAASEPPGESLDNALDRYVNEHRPAWKDSTTRTYLSALRTFRAWASSSSVLAVSDLDAAALSRFRAYALTLTRRTKAKGGSRHDVVATEERRSAAAINCELRAIKTMAQWLRRVGLVDLGGDAIADNLRLLAVDHPKPDPLRPAQLRELLDACLAHDAAEVPPVGFLVATMLLTGMRLGEALRLTWADVDLSDMAIRVVPGKKRSERTVDLTVSPCLIELLRHNRSRGLVFPSDTPDSRSRLIDAYGAPHFHWSTRHSRPGDRSPPTLRSTCGCYLTCAPSIFGGASIYRSAAQLGHSVQVAERHYIGQLRRIPASAETLDAAMGIEGELRALLTAERRLRVVR